MSSRPSMFPSSSSGTSNEPQADPSGGLNRISARDLTESQIRLLNASQCLQLTDQLDQELLSLMQSLDGHFLRATRTVTETLLPNVERYGEASRDIWDSVKYFKTFFEIAAGIKLTDGTSTDQPEDEQDASLPQEQQSEAGDRTAMTEDESTVTEGPNTSAAYASFGQHDPSPFEQLQRDAEKQFGISSDPTKSPGASHAQQQQQQQYRPDGKRIRTRDLSFDSPDNTLDDTVDKPELETMSLDPSKVRQGKLNDVSAQEDSPFIAKPKPSSSAAKDKPPHGSVTAATAAKARTSTPAKAKYASPATSAKLASHLPPGWSAHKPTDLSKTPLTGQSTRSYQPSNISDVSSPPEMTYAFSHLPSKIARTPGKKAAQWMTQDILETAALQLGEHQEDPMSALDSPVIEPPSVIKNWDKRNYDRDAPESPIRGAPSASSSANKQHYGRVVDDDDDEGDHGQGSVVEHDDVSFGSIGDAPIEDWEQHEGKTADVSGDETHQLSEQMDSRLGGFDGVEEGEEDSFDQRQEAPDTLFGGRQQPRQLDRLDGFLKVHNAGEMHTLHGGQLIEAQPFDASPLQGRDVRHGL